MDIHEAKKLIDQRTVTIVDIRDPETFQQGRIQGAVSLNDANLEDFLRTLSRMDKVFRPVRQIVNSQNWRH